MDHVWLGKRATIAKEIDGLGDQFRPAMSAGWLTYIKNAYPAGGVTVQLPAHPLNRGLWSLMIKYDVLRLLLPPRRRISEMNTDPKCCLEF